MGKIKTYQTMVIFTANQEFKEKYGFRSHQSQHTVVCATTSYKKANEWAESIGLGRDVFKSEYTYVLDREELIEECQKHGGFIIETNNNKYASIHEALK